MSSWQSLSEDETRALCVAPGTSHAEAMRRLNDTAMQILIVVSDEGRLLGTITDGDIRRAILNGRSLEDSISGTFNGRPVTVRADDTAHSFERLRASAITAAPVVDRDGTVRGLVRLTLPTTKRTALVLAGGRGTRLGTLTESTPKPLLTVGDRPLLAHLLDNLDRSGFSTVYIAVHHLAEQIVTFVDESRPEGLDIRYVREEAPLGTAGALGEIATEIVEPILVLNGDLVTQTSFAAMMDFHIGHGKAVTVGCAQYRHEVPFGVIELAGNEVTRLVEKPQIRRFVSAGVYVLDPLVFRMVPRGQAMDMPALINMALEAGLNASTFPIVEYWIDIGRPEQLAQARGDFRSGTLKALTA